MEVFENEKHCSDTKSNVVPRSDDTRLNIACAFGRDDGRTAGVGGEWEAEDALLAKRARPASPYPAQSIYLINSQMKRAS